LNETEGTYFQIHYQLLESLSVVKSAFLLADLNDDELTTDFFREIFDTIS